jgi:hypothetical protein
VQLVEVSLTGVRSAVITLRSPAAAMRIILVSVVHLGSPDYYRSLAARLAECDLIVAEGISGRSVASWALALAYRLPARNRRLGLTVQDIDYASLGVPVLVPDMTARQFGKGLRSISLLQRLAVLCLIPPIAFSFAVLGTRRTLSRYLDTDDLPTYVDDQVRQAFPQLTELVLEHRDSLLVDCLESIHRTRQHEDIDVAVVYGAGHMRSVTRELFGRHGYRPRSADWMTVFDF